MARDHFRYVFDGVKIVKKNQVLIVVLHLEASHNVVCKQ